MAVYLHKYNFKVVVYAWKVLNWTTMGFCKRQLHSINLIHTFATFFLLSHTKLAYVSILLLTVMHISTQDSIGQPISGEALYSFDPNIHYFKQEQILYSVLALVIFTFIGMLLPLTLIIYPTCCGTWLGNKCKWKRIRIAVRTFIEAFNGSYNDGLTGTKDYRAVPGILLSFRSAFVAFFSLRIVNIIHAELTIFCGALVFMTLAAFFGLLKPYKIKRHNLNDVLIFCGTAIQCLIFFMTASVNEVDANTFHIITAITLSCFFLFIFNMFMSFIMSVYLKIC